MRMGEVVTVHESKIRKVEAIRERVRDGMEDFVQNS
jgi:hypothetical protein